MPPNKTEKKWVLQNTYCGELKKEIKTDQQKLWQENPFGQFRGTKIPQNTKKITFKENCLPIAHWEYFSKLKAAESEIQGSLNFSLKIRQYLLSSVVQKEKNLNLIMPKIKILTRETESE